MFRDKRFWDEDKEQYCFVEVMYMYMYVEMYGLFQTGRLLVGTVLPNNHKIILPQMSAVILYLS
jgi:hypothetical protein